MNYKIIVYTKFDEQPDEDLLNFYVDEVVDVLSIEGGHCDFSYYFEHITPNSIQDDHHSYRISATINTDKVITSVRLFEVLNNIRPIVLVNVKDATYTKSTDSTDEEGIAIYWENDGETTYHDGSTYYDPHYIFHYNNRDDYRITYIPTYTRKMSERDKERYGDHLYMWSCTGCWDMWLEAQTIEEAIEEFEKMYHEKLWNRVEGLKEYVTRSIDAYREFSQYRMNKGRNITDI